MELRMSEKARIENPRQYSIHAVEDLRCLLLSGSQAERDPHREHFYNIEGDKSSYYIHISPFSGNVTLLAKWARRASECYAAAEHLVA